MRKRERSEEAEALREEFASSYLIKTSRLPQATFLSAYVSCTKLVILVEWNC